MEKIYISVIQLIHFYIQKDEEIPNGWYLGQHQTSNKGKITVINNEGIQKYVYPNEIPNGFIKGSKNKGMIFSEIHKMNISKSVKLRTNRKRGFHLSNETKLKIGLSQKIRIKEHPLSEEQRKAISIRNSGNNNGHHKLKGKVMFINNGIIQKLHDKNLPIPNGWNKGMLKQEKRKAGKFRWIHNIETLTNKIIGIDDPLPIGFAEKMARRK